MIPTSPIQAKRITQRAKDAAERIGEKPTSVVFRNAKLAFLPAQTVRLETSNDASEMTSTAGATPRMNVIIFGVRGHPTIPDTNMGEGYTFNIGNDRYRIKDIILQTGEIQGIAVISG